MAITRCIVTAPPRAYSEVLINPANEKLVGTKFPYFPRGGPVPDESPHAAAAQQRNWLPPGFVSQWGGMEAGVKMVYPVQAVDGMVGMLGGWELRRECQRLPVLASSRSGVRCAIGDAVRTPATGGLRAQFRTIVHTVPPFFAQAEGGGPCPQWRAGLESCWRRALSVAEASTAGSPEGTIVAPLLGAGVRGAPLEAAIGIAIHSVASWLFAPEPVLVDKPARELILVVQSADTARMLAEEMSLWSDRRRSGLT